MKENTHERRREMLDDIVMQHVTGTETWAPLSAG
jgi:hypothetical protein